MTIKNAFEHYVKSLSSLYDVGEAESIARLFFEERIGLKSSDLILREEETISQVNANDLAWKLLRLMKGEPAQYVLGYCHFYGLKLKVNKSVLIPRPETEELVDWIIKNNKNKEALKIIDIGTGSGCIAIALKKNIPQSQVYALDISEEALKVTDENADVNGVELNLIHADILSSQFKLSYSPFNIIVSNPPYVLEREKISLHQNVLQFEPPCALLVPDDEPLIFYEAILRLSKEHMVHNAEIYFEVNPEFANEILNKMTTREFSSAEIRKDLSGKPRMVKGILL